MKWAKDDLVSSNTHHATDAEVPLALREIAAIAVVAQDGAIGRRGHLLCHLPADLKHFKHLTMGHSIIMGRRTFESFPKGALPGRQNIVITRNSHFTAPDVTVAHSIDEAIAAATMPGEVFIIGGAQIYQAAMPLVGTLHLTRLHATFDGADAFFPAINPHQWETTFEEHHDPDERNPYPYSFVTLTRIRPTKSAV